MSKDLIVLTPNGRRQKVHCNPDTSILQILEDVCEKQGFEATEYDLKHHNHLLDLTSTIRFSNLPNKAMLEMVEAERHRTETNVTIGLMMEDGERRTADFPPNTSLYDLITAMAPGELGAFQQPTIQYMRQEVIGLPALREKTLRQLGLIRGRAILRLLNKSEEPKQANVSAVYNRQPQPETHAADGSSGNSKMANISAPHAKPEVTIDTIKQIKKEKLPTPEVRYTRENKVTKEDESQAKAELMEVDKDTSPSITKQSNASTTSLVPQRDLERRLKIEEEVTFLGTQKAIAFMQPDHFEEELEDLPDDFYELTVEEVRKLYHDLQQHRLEMENTPLITNTKREDIMRETSELRLKIYKNVVVRVQFPEHIILQGVFGPMDTIEDITSFIKQHLRNPDKPFHIFTTPLKESLDPKMTLLEAKFVPCVHMHFKWLDDDSGDPCLKEEVYANQTSSDAAGILASKYRAPTRRKVENEATVAAASSSKSSKVPRWFK